MTAQAVATATRLDQTRRTPATGTPTAGLLTTGTALLGIGTGLVLLSRSQQPS